MRRVCVGSVSLLALLAMAIPSSAQSPQMQIMKARMEAQAAAAAKEQALTTEKLNLARQIIRAREDALQRGPFSEAVVNYWTDRLMRLSVGHLESISWAGPTVDLNSTVATLSGQMAADGVSPDLGDSSADLVYTKITPCRVVDTRVAGGALPNASARSFNVAGTNPAWFTPQGGNPCGIPLGATAVAANLTVTGTAGYGWLRAYPYGGSGNASVINYNGTADLANGLVLPICDPAGATLCANDLTVVADAAGTQVLIDVMGYFQQVNKANYRTFTNVSSTGATTSLPVGGACTSYTSITLTAPGPGQIIVTANVNLRMGHTLGTDTAADWGIGTSTTDCGYTWGLDGAFANRDSTLPTAVYYDWTTATHTVTVPAAGTYTYYVTGRRTLGTGALDFWWGGMRATFNPS